MTIQPRTIPSAGSRIGSSTSFEYALRPGRSVRVHRIANNAPTPTAISVVSAANASVFFHAVQNAESPKRSRYGWKVKTPPDSYSGRSRSDASSRGTKGPRTSTTISAHVDQWSSPGGRTARRGFGNVRVVEAVVLIARADRRVYPKIECQRFVKAGRSLTNFDVKPGTYT